MKRVIRKKQTTHLKPLIMAARKDKRKSKRIASKHAKKNRNIFVQKHGKKKGIKWCDDEDNDNDDRFQYTLRSLIDSDGYTVFAVMISTYRLERNRH